MRFNCLIAGLVLSLATLTAQAIPITDTVIVGDKEWAQVNLFSDLSWTEMNAVCPNGVCGSGTLNDWDMTGWSWASALEMGDLFNDLTPHPGGIAFVDEDDSSWAPAFFDDIGFEPTFSGTNFRFVTGLTSSLSPDNSSARLAGLRDAFVDSDDPALDRAINTTTAGVDSSLPVIGGWFYRSHAPVDVPEPVSLSLLGLGMAGLVWQLRRRRMCPLATAC